MTVCAVDPEAASNQNVVKFLDHAQKLEENTRASCPLPPNCIADKYSRIQKDDYFDFKRIGCLRKGVVKILLYNRQEEDSMVTDKS